MRFFKKYIGVSCLEYIKNLRLEKAASRLAQGGQSVLDVSMSCGVSNLSYFYREFKKKYGMTPKQFIGRRRRCRFCRRKITTPAAGCPDSLHLYRYRRYFRLYMKFNIIETIPQGAPPPDRRSSTSPTDQIQVRRSENDCCKNHNTRIHYSDQLVSSVCISSLAQDFFCLPCSVVLITTLQAFSLLYSSMLYLLF